MRLHSRDKKRPAPAARLEKMTDYPVAELHFIWSQNPMLTIVAITVCASQPKIAKRNRAHTSIALFSTARL